MEKPQIVRSNELTVEQLKKDAQEKGFEYINNYDLETDIKDQIKRLKTGSSSRFKKGMLSPGYDLAQLEYALEYLKWEKDKKEKEVGMINGTTRQSTLAIHFMQKALKFPRTTGNKVEDAVFVKFLIGKNYDEIYDLLSIPLKRPDEKIGKATQSLIKDLTIVRNQFNKIQFFEGVKLVDIELDKLENDLNTFNPV